MKKKPIWISEEAHTKLTTMADGRSYAAVVDSLLEGDPSPIDFDWVRRLGTQGYTVSIAPGVDDDGEAG